MHYWETKLFMDFHINFAQNYLKLLIILRLNFYDKQKKKTRKSRKKDKPYSMTWQIQPMHVKF